MKRAIGNARFCKNVFSPKNNKIVNTVIGSHSIPATLLLKMSRTDTKL